MVTKKAVNEHCDFCTEVMKNCDPYWDLNCRETAFQILYKCRYFTGIRRQIFNKFTIKHNQLFSKDIAGTLLKIIDYIDKSKAFTKVPKWSKRDISPNRIIYRNRKKGINPTQHCIHQMNQKKKIITYIYYISQVKQIRHYLT